MFFLRNLASMSTPPIEEARKALESGDFSNAEKIYQEILLVKNGESQSSSSKEQLVQKQEQSILELGQLYKDHNKKQELVNLIPKSRAVMGSFAKSKTAKITKHLIDLVESLPDSLDLSIEITKDCIAWAVEEKRSFLRQSLQLRLASLYYRKTSFLDSIAIIDKLLKEFKKLDDKSSLVEVQLLEAKNYLSLKNFAKSRACLTSARTSANAIYCPTQLQAELDLMSGILHAEDKDFKTAFSYFYESLENFALHDDESKSIIVLKYMLLSKIMLNLVDDVVQLLKSKTISKYTNNRDIEAIREVSKAHDNRSLREFEECLRIYNQELAQDPIVKSHIMDLYNSLFEQNLLKLIEPYSVVEVSYLAQQIGLSTKVVENKLGQMILDKVFFGVLDQGNGWLIIYEESQADKSYEISLDLIKNMSKAVDLLYERASTLN
ncbi:hypothetical protein LJB42_004101 [Komagataella kurtzmanii]|nr:hypothetical protein LJB42_004101 [Komagataella kurtzmanii]